MRFKLKRFLILAAVLVLSGFVVFQHVTKKSFLVKYSNTGYTEESQENKPLTTDAIPPEVTIATVVCSTENNTVPREEAIVMIKSVIISSLLYKVTILKFHLFVEHLDDAEVIVADIKKFSENVPQISIELNIHSAVAAVPKEYRYHMIYHYQFRCTYVRIFLSKILKDVDSLLYLDTDTIVIGSIVDMWSHFKNMTGEKLIGAVQNNEPDNPYWSKVYEKWFADIPHPPPKGINAGILLMNLTKMRIYEWQTKILRLFDDYSKLYIMNDQRLLNILLRYDQGLLHPITCQFNFKSTHCNKGLYCNASIIDPKGIQIIHGASNRFDEGESFHEIYLAYKNLEEVAKETDIKTVLMKEIRDRYSINSVYKTKISPVYYSWCFGTIDKLLFKNHFV